MLTKNFQKLQADVITHVVADRVTHGNYEPCFTDCLANGHHGLEFMENEYGIPLMVSRIAESIFEGLPADEAILFFAAIREAIGSDGKDLTRVGWQFLAAELRALPPVPDDIQVCIGSVIEGMDLLADGKEWPVAAVNDAVRARANATAIKASTNAAAIKAADYAAAIKAADYAVRSANSYTWPARAAARATHAARAAIYATRVTTYAKVHAAANAVLTANAIHATHAISIRAAHAALLRQRDTLLRLIKEAPINTQEGN